jgi:DNA-directed RNA polymerase specialized sigma24 family protein
MPDKGSVTRLFDQLQTGNPVAVQKLWERYFAQLVSLARKKLRDVPRRAADEEDVALNAFASFCRRAEEGRFPQLSDRDGLWRLLVVITVRKASHLRRSEGQQKRGGLAAGLAGEAGAAALEGMIDTEPTPEFAAEVAEECSRLLALLEDPELQTVARHRMEGCTSKEIATALDCTERTVERRLRLIRDIWEREMPT